MGHFAHSAPPRQYRPAAGMASKRTLTTPDGERPQTCRPLTCGDHANIGADNSASRPSGRVGSRRVIRQPNILGMGAASDVVGSWARELRGREPLGLVSYRVARPSCLSDTVYDRLMTGCLRISRRCHQPRLAGLPDFLVFGRLTRKYFNMSSLSMGANWCWHTRHWRVWQIAPESDLIRTSL